MSTPVNISLTEGDDYARVISFASGGSAVNLTGYTFVAKARKSVTSAVAFSFAVVVRTQTGGDVGKVDWTLAASATASLGLKGPTAYLYDIKRTDPSGKIQTIFSGTITVSPGIS